MLNENVIAQTKDVLKDMKDPVEMTYFTQEVECEPCTTVSAFVDDLAAVDDRLRIRRRDFAADAGLAKGMDVHHIPALVLHRPGGGSGAVRYYGLPGGYEYGAFLRTLVLFSGGDTALPVDREKVAKIDKEINLKVFVLTTCPSCPVMAHLAAALAWMNPLVTTEIIEANAFVDLATRFTVGAVPKTVVDDSVEIVGVLPPEEFLRRITES